MRLKRKEKGTPKQAGTTAEAGLTENGYFLSTTQRGARMRLRTSTTSTRKGGNTHAVRKQEGWQEEAHQEEVNDKPSAGGSLRAFKPRGKT